MIPHRTCGDEYLNNAEDSKFAMFEMFSRRWTKCCNWYRFNGSDDDDGLQIPPLAASKHVRPLSLRLV